MARGERNFRGSLIVVGTRMTLRIDFGYDNLSRFGASQRHFISHQGVFHRVIEGSLKHILDCSPLDKPHLYHTFTECAVTKHFHDNGRLARLKIG